MENKIQTQLKEARERRLILLMQRDDLTRHFSVLQNQIQIIERDICAADGEVLGLSKLLESDTPEQKDKD